MTATEDDLRALLAERATRVPALPEARAGVERAIRRRRQQYVVGGMAGLTLLGAAAAGVAVTSGSDHVARPTSRMLTTIRPASTGFVFDRDIVLPRSGLAFHVNCGNSAAALVIRIDQRWLGGIDCAKQRSSVSYDVPAAAYRALGVRAGAPATLSVDTDGSRWTIAVSPGPAPRPAARFAPEPTSLPPDPTFRVGAPGAVFPQHGKANGTVTTTLTLRTRRVAVAIECAGPGTVTLSLRTPNGRTDDFSGTPCGLLAEHPITNLDQVDFAVHAGEPVVVSVTASDFDQPTWRAALVRMTGRDSFVPLSP